jgi:hypothetical protein
MSALVFDLLCAICFTLASTSTAQRGARCGAVTEKVADGCPGKLIETEPRTVKPHRERRKRTGGKAAEAEEAAEATAR